jgi:hypothetical protein
MQNPGGGGIPGDEMNSPLSSVVGASLQFILTKEGRAKVEGPIFPLSRRSMLRPLRLAVVKLLLLVVGDPPFGKDFVDA